MGFGSTTFNGLNERQAYDTLRDLVSKIESGEVRVLGMSLTQEAPETRSFRTMDGRMDRQMVVSAGEMTVEVRVALCDPLRAEPMESRDEKGRLRGATTAGPPKWQGDRMFSEMTREEQIAFVDAARKGEPGFTGEGVVFPRPKVTPAAPAPPPDPLMYGARKVDLD